MIGDDGMGISSKDLKYVTKKYYVGSNGRSVEKSTGIRLYLSEWIMEKQSIKFEISSE